MANVGDGRLLRLGLNAMARAHETDYFADGHRGAGMVAAHLLRLENDIDSRGWARIGELVDINWASLRLCAPFPDEPAEPERLGEIGDALLEGAAELRQVGHNVIFSMIALKAFRMVPDAATARRIRGVCAVIRSFTPLHDVEPDPDVQPPEFTDAHAMARYVLREASDAVDRFIDYGQGHAGHLLTFGQALIELAAMGDVELAESCRGAFRKYVTVTRRGPDADSKPIPEHKESDLRPNQSEYWARRGDHAVDIGHAFKYPYSYYALLRRANDSDLAAEWDAKAFRLF